MCRDGMKEVENPDEKAKLLEAANCFDAPKFYDPLRKNLDNIDSDEEYEIAADAFDELMDTEQFNEMEENSTEE